MNDIQSHRQISKSHILFCVALALVFFWPLRLWAQTDTEGIGARAFWAGWYEGDRIGEALELGFDVTVETDALWGIGRWGIRPQFGGLVTTDKSVYAFGGFRYTVPIPGDNWRIDMSSAVGLFEKGDGKDLGGVVQFRSGLDLMRRVSGGNYLSFAFYHISNAGFYEHNPGSNTLLLRYVLTGNRKRRTAQPRD